MDSQPPVEPTLEEVLEAEEQAIRREGRAAELAKLRAAGVGIVRAYYSGSGDSGDFHEFQFHTGHGEYAAAVKVSLDLEDDVSNLFSDYLYDAYGGWEDEDGGGGEFVWDIATDVITHEHYQNIVTQHNEDTRTL